MKNSMRAMLSILLVAVLAISGGYFYLIRAPDVEVDEGYALIKHSLRHFGVDSVGRNASAVTLINNGSGILNLTVRMRSVIAPVGDSVSVWLEVSVNVNLPEEIMPEGLKIQAQESENSRAAVDFYESFNKYMNATPWPSEKIRPGAWAPHTAYIGCTPHRTSFGMITEIGWDIMDYCTIREHTMRIKAELLGFTNSVTSTVDVVIDTSAVGYAHLIYRIFNTTDFNPRGKISSIALINGTGILNLTAELYSIRGYGDFLEMGLNLSVRADDLGFVPQGLRLELMVRDRSKGAMYFDMEMNNLTNATLWERENITVEGWIPLSINLGCTPHRSSFELKTVAHWFLYNAVTLPKHTMQIKAELLGESNSVISVAIIYITLHSVS